MDVKLEIIDLKNQDAVNHLKLDLKLYGFDITFEDLVKLIPIPNKLQNIFTQNVGRYRSSTGMYTKIIKIIGNSRGSLKLVILENGGYFIAGNHIELSGNNSIGIWDMSYDKRKKNDIYSSFKEGIFLVFNEGYSSQWRFACVTDCSTIEQMQKWVETWKDIEKKIESNCSFREMGTVNGKEHSGLISLEMLQSHKVKVDEKIIEIEALEVQEKLTQASALKNIILLGQTIKLLALDSRAYEIEFSPEYHIDASSSYFAYMVYWHRYNKSYGDATMFADGTILFTYLMQYLMQENIEWFKISINGIPAVKVQKKFLNTRSDRRPTELFYLNDARVAYDSVIPCLTNYLLRSKPLVFPKQTEPLDLAEVRKRNKENLEQNGISGTLTDLEGDIPIKIAFEKIGSVWSLVIGELKVPLKGGIATIKSLHNILKGSTGSYSARHSTEEFYRRLCTVLPQEDAISIIANAKEMGKLIEAMEGNKNG